MTSIKRMTLSVLGLLLSCAVLIALSLSSVQAAPLALPPRPTAEPTLPSSGSAITGGTIVLHVVAPPSGLWATVEWQDVAGNWHLVDGWQGTLESDGTKTWWVAQADRGKGPFRWVLYDRRGGKVWAISQAFYLPSINRQSVVSTLEGPNR